MQKLKIWWYSFIHSLIDPKYYRDILRSKLSFSIQYLGFFLTLSILILILGSLIPNSLNVKSIFNLPDRIQTIATNAYPSELVVTIKNGELSTNVKEPYAIHIQEFENKDY